MKNSHRRRPLIAASDVTIIGELSQEEEEEGALIEAEVNSTRPRRIALFVEPSPFASVFLSNYASSLQLFIFIYTQFLVYMFLFVTQTLGLCFSVELH